MAFTRKPKDSANNNLKAKENGWFLLTQKIAFY